VSEPQRTCIGCRGRAAKAALLRVTWQRDVGPVVDLRQTAPGRGAYLHPRPVCLQLAVKRRAAGRALRVSGVDPDALTAAVGPHLERD
jgi:predicted RNA-binding protein YlxR (DUF448 family)